MFHPNPLFSDGCVLCHGREIALFGEADDGARVTARLSGAGGQVLGEAACTARNGHFLLYLPAQKPQTGCTLTFACGPESTVIADVAVGEVWLAGGQSNMELALANVDGGREEAAAHDDPLLRFFDVPKWARACEEADTAFAGTRWQKALPGQAAWVSAVAYWFAKKTRAHRDMPVGVIDCWWGGTSVTCWLPEEVLRATAAGRRYLTEYEEKSAGVTMEDYLKAEDAFMRELNAWNDRVARIREIRGQDTPWAEIEAQAGPCPWFPPVGPGSQYRPHCLYDHMLRRIMPVSLNGFLWYQGEEDACRTDRYDLLMAQLITQWRRDFGGEALPFLFVQLPAWNNEGDHEAWPRLRLQQAAVRDALRNTGLAVTIDLGERDNIHPTDKRPVGERLFELARTAAWGENGETSPEAVALEHLPGALRVCLSNPVRTPEAPARGFELCVTEEKWVPAEAEIRRDEILLTAKEIPEPLHARYAFLDWPEVHVFGENGLPLAPFRI